MQVYYTNKDPEHDLSGHYVWFEDDDGNETRIGPFLTRAEALNAASDGAYSDYMESLMEDRRLGTYRDQMIDAGRGHQLQDDD